MKNNKIYLVALQIFWGVGVGMYAYIGNFTRMMADDFCSANMFNRLGLFRSLWFIYTKWNSRYSAYVVDWFVLRASLGPYGLHYFVPLMLILWLVLLVSFFYLYFKDKGASAFLHSSILGAGFLFTLLLITPNIEQSLFWWNSARSYSLSLMLFTLSLFVLYSMRRSAWFTDKSIYSMGFILFFMLGGFGETYAVGQAGILAFVIFLFILDKQEKSKTDLFILAAGLAGAALSLLVIVTTPGNNLRHRMFPTPTLETLVTVSIKSYSDFVYFLVDSPVKVAGIFSAALLYFWMGMQYKDRISANGWLVGLNIIVGILLPFATFLPGVYGFSEPPPTRTLMVPAFFSLISLLYASYLMGGIVKAPIAYERLVIALVIFLAGYSSIVNSIDWLGQRQNYINFAQKWDEVDKQILEAKANNQPEVRIRAMNNWAYLEVPTNNQNYWATRCTTRYYEIRVYGPYAEEIQELYNQPGYDFR